MAEVFEEATETFSLLFDGSDVLPRSADLDAIEVQEDGTLYMSFSARVFVPGLGWVEDEDVVRFQSSSLGPDTEGQFHRFLVGDRNGLFGLGVNVDAIDVPR